MFSLTIYVIILLLLVYSFGLWLDLMFRKVKDELWLFIVLVFLGLISSLTDVIFFQILLFLAPLFLLIALTLESYLGGADFKGLVIFYFYFVFLYLKHVMQNLFITMKISYSHNFLTSIFWRYLLVELFYFGIFVFCNLLLFLILLKKRKTYAKKIEIRPPFFFGLLILFVLSLL